MALSWSNRDYTVNQNVRCDLLNAPMVAHPTWSFQKIRVDLTHFTPVDYCSQTGWDVVNRRDCCFGRAKGSTTGETLDAWTCAPSWIPYDSTVSACDADMTSGCFVQTTVGCLADKNGVIPPSCPLLLADPTKNTDAAACVSWCGAHQQQCDSAKVNYCSINPTRPECGCLNPQPTTVLSNGMTYQQVRDAANVNMGTRGTTSSTNLKCWWPPCQQPNVFRTSTIDFTSVCPTGVNFCAQQGKAFVINGSVIPPNGIPDSTLTKGCVIYDVVPPPAELTPSPPVPTEQPRSPLTVPTPTPTSLIIIAAVVMASIGTITVGIWVYRRRHSTKNVKSQ